MEEDSEEAVFANTGTIEVDITGKANGCTRY